MKHLMNIDEIYFNLVKIGQKTHEYRLYDDKRKTIKIGDIIELVNNRDKNLKIEVKVINIQVFKNWESALKNTYESDFQGLYSSLKETVEACQKFYSQENINKYGIVVFEIKKTSM